MKAAVNENPPNPRRWVQVNGERWPNIAVNNQKLFLHVKPWYRYTYWQHQHSFFYQYRVDARTNQYANFLSIQPPQNHHERKLSIYKVPSLTRCLRNNQTYLRSPYNYSYLTNLKFAFIASVFWKKNYFSELSADNVCDLIILAFVLNFIFWMLMYSVFVLNMCECLYSGPTSVFHTQWTFLILHHSWMSRVRNTIKI